MTLADGSRSARPTSCSPTRICPTCISAFYRADGTAKSLLRKQFSCSAISFFWGVDKTYDALSPHTLFLAHDYRENFEAIVRDLSLPANPSLYVHAPTRLDPSMAPPGQDTLAAIVPVGHLSDDGKQDWQELRDRARDHVFRRLATLGIDDLDAHIKFEEAYTPLVVGRAIST